MPHALRSKQNVTTPENPVIKRLLAINPDETKLIRTAITTLKTKRDIVAGFEALVELGAAPKPKTMLSGDVVGSRLFVGIAISHALIGDFPDHPSSKLWRNTISSTGLPKFLRKTRPNE